MIDRNSIVALRQAVEERGVGGELRMCLCADVCAYICGPFSKHADGILQFYNTAMELIGERVRYYLFDGEGRFKKIKSGVLDALPQWVSGEVASRYVYGLDLESGDKAGEQSDSAFQMYVPDEGVGFVRLILPAEVLLEPDIFVKNALSCLVDLDFVSAYAGFAVNANRHYDGTSEGSKLSMISKRFRGVDLGSPLFFSDYLAKYVKCVNWLTFLGGSLMELLPGIEGKLAKYPTVFRHQGALFKASEFAGIGDVNRREFLYEYAKVGCVLSPLRIPLDVLGPYDEIGGGANTRDWLARFDSPLEKGSDDSI